MPRSGLARSRRPGGSRRGRPGSGRVRRRRSLPRWLPPRALPGRAATGSPPAAVIRSGIQCPALNGGSTHSTSATLGRSRPATAALTAASRERRPETRSAARSATPVRLPTSRIESRTSVRVCGSSETHVGLAAEVAEGVLDVTGGERADSAQVLGQDQFWLEPGQGVGVQRVQVGAGGQLGADVAVDLAWCHALGVAAADHDRFLGAGRRRLVALEGDADQVIAQAERVNDLRGRWQQRD